MILHVWGPDTDKAASELAKMSAVVSLEPDPDEGIRVEVPEGALARVLVVLAEYIVRHEPVDRERPRICARCFAAAQAARLSSEAAEIPHPECLRALTSA